MANDIKANIKGDFSSKHSEVTDYYRIDKDEYLAYQVKRGLRNMDGSGVLAGLTNVSEVHGYVVSESEKMPIQGELSSRGYNINDLTRSFGIDNRFGFEEISYLLLFGTLPTRSELTEYCDFLAQSRELPAFFTEDMILKNPSKDIMNKLARSVLTLYSYDKNPDDCSIENVITQSIKLMARMPIIAAHAYSAKRHYFDNKSLILHRPKAELSIAENILRMLSKNKEFTEEDARILDTTLMLHAEHGGGNNSTFTCRVLSSSGTDTYSAIASAISSLKGPRHGGANAKVMSMMGDIQKNVHNWENRDEIYEYLCKIVRKEAHDKSGLIYGVGHAVYTLSDPRAVILKANAKSLADRLGYQEEYNLYTTIEELAPIVFKDVKQQSKMICTNVDFYSGFVYKMLKIPPEIYTPLFAISRTAGWCAHRIEEIISGGKIIRPAYKSLCRNSREYVPMNER
ncbi:MAG: citrate/2-methylcitrate synthase [Clostridia bacterium]|nr:citrate/2-methylcitrate synthase [Clostridia bacterium]